MKTCHHRNMSSFANNFWWLYEGDLKVNIVTSLSKGHKVYVGTKQKLTLMKFAKDLNMDLMARNYKDKTGFHKLSFETREKLREKFPDLVPDEELC